MEEETRPEEPKVYYPTNAEHLQTLVDDVLAPLLDGRPVRADDGTIYVTSGSAVVELHDGLPQPEIELVSRVVIGFKDAAAAAREVQILNHDTRYIKFVVHDDVIWAQYVVRAMPFVPEHLVFGLRLMAHTIDDVDDNLVARVGGLRATDPAPTKENVVKSDDENGQGGYL